MQTNSTEIRYLLNGPGSPESMTTLRALRPFDPLVKSFLSELSEYLRGRVKGRQYPDITTFAFFIRKANLTLLEKPYDDRLVENVGRGLSFHIAPSNVPINFAYSMVAGLLSGNACIVRVSEKEFPQVGIVCDAIKQVLSGDDYNQLKNYICIIQYGHSQAINDRFSSICDIRVVWGGDQTISSIRKSELPPRSLDISFSDRYSICLIDAASYLSHEDKPVIAERFFNDTYLFDQNACSSPRLIFWLGDPPLVALAKKTFWHSVADVLHRKDYKTEAVTAVNKYVMFCRQAILSSGMKLEGETWGAITRLRLATLDTNLPQFSCAGGYYVEYEDTSFEKLPEIINSKYQTLTYLGLNPCLLRDFLFQRGVKGVDRIVPIGEAASFSLTWDGYDLISQMTRKMVAL